MQRGQEEPAKAHPEAGICEVRSPSQPPRPVLGDKAAVIEAPACGASVPRHAAASCRPQPLPVQWPNRPDCSFIARCWIQLARRSALVSALCLRVRGILSRECCVKQVGRSSLARQAGDLEVRANEGGGGPRAARRHAEELALGRRLGGARLLLLRRIHRPAFEKKFCE